MRCAHCGSSVEDGARFCQNCGASLTAPDGVIYQPPMQPQLGQQNGSRSPRRSTRQQDPYKEQITQLKLQIRQLKLNLKHITVQMSGTRSGYYETAAFVPRGLLREGYKIFEDIRLLGPQQQKQRLQQEIMVLEQQLLGLQQAQAQWKAQQ